MTTLSERKRNLTALRNFIVANVKQQHYDPDLFGSKPDTSDDAPVGCLMYHAYNEPTNTVLPNTVSNLFYDHEQVYGYPAHAFESPELIVALDSHYFEGAHNWFQSPPKRLRDAIKRLNSEIAKCERLISENPPATTESTSESTTVAVNGITFNASIKDGKVSINAEGLTLKQFMEFVKG